MAWAPNYVTTAELRAYATRSTETVDDVDIALAISAVSRAIDRAANRQFGIVDSAEERTYPACWDRRLSAWQVAIDDLQTTTGLVIGGVAYDADLHTLNPLNAAQEGRPWERIALASNPGDEVTIEASWGWSSVPDSIKLASLLQGNRIFSRRTAPFGIAGSPEQGSEMRLLARLDPDVAVTIGPFKRWWSAK